MLVLARRSGQKILLKTSDGTVEVLFKEFARGNAYLAFKAPKAVNIVREELTWKTLPAARRESGAPRGIHRPPTRHEDHRGP